MLLLTLKKESPSGSFLSGQKGSFGTGKTMKTLFSSALTSSLLAWHGQSMANPIHSFLKWRIQTEEKSLLYCRLNHCRQQVGRWQGSSLPGVAVISEQASGPG